MPNIKHYIIVKFKEGVNKQELIKPVSELFKGTLNIDGVLEVNIILSNSDLPNRFDIMIEMIVTKDGLYNYDNSDLHKKWKTDYREYILSKAIFDCDAQD